jgi:hypothetical protein
MIGGTATLGWSFGGTSGTFVFCIDGEYGEPDPSVVQAQLGSNPWYLFQIAEHESPGVLQFTATAPFWPVFGPPSGFGIMQIDPPTSELDLFSWVQNVADGVAKAQNLETSATTFWKRQVYQYKQWVKANPTTAPPPPSPDPESNCGSFVYGTPLLGQHSFSGAIGIKKYNGLGLKSVSSENGYNYIIWQNTGANQLNPLWAMYPYTVVGGKDHYYVSDVCKQNTGP